MRVVSRALLRATAAIRHGRADLPNLPGLAAPFDRIGHDCLFVLSHSFFHNVNNHFESQIQYARAMQIADVFDAR